MKLSRVSVGLAIRALRERAGLTLGDLAAFTGMTTSSLSRSENGLRDLAFTEVIDIAATLKVDIEVFYALAKALERVKQDWAEKRERVLKLERDLNQLRQAAVEAAIKARGSRMR